MADTPLHEHEAVKHLMGTEHWPKQSVGTFPVELTLATTDDGAWVWSFVSRLSGQRTTAPCSNDLAHSLITLAAVRGMAAKGWYTRTRWCGDSGHPACCEAVQLGGYRPLIRAFAGLTEPLAILAAYQATVMEGGK